MLSVPFDYAAVLPADLRQKTERNSAPLQEQSRISAWCNAAEANRPPRALRYPFPLDAIPTVPGTGITIPRKGQ